MAAAPRSGKRANRCASPAGSPWTAALRRALAWCRTCPRPGAKITIDDPNVLPAKLRLAFSRDARTGRNCEVVWRRGKAVGVKFVR